MNVIETRFGGRQANLAGITRFVNRHVGGGPLARVELRYSTQAAEPLHPQAAKLALGKLLREHGMAAVAISVRAHEGPLDDATGEHLLRLIPAELRPPSPMAEAPRARGLRAWLARLFPRWFKAGRVSAEGVGEPPQLQIKKGEAVARLRQAIDVAKVHLEGDAGLAPGRDAERMVAEIQVMVRLTDLHDVLGPLVDADAAKAAESIGHMLRSKGLGALPTLRVSYVYRPRIAGDGTGYAGEDDLEVRLVLADMSASKRSGGADGQATVRSAASVTREPAQAIGTTAIVPGTLLPMPRPQREHAMTVRVLGTMEGAFPEPFEFHFDDLPAHFDRSALEKAGFGARHPTLLAVASNTCPLVISQSDSGMLWVQARGRSTASGVVMPMYYLRDSMVGIAEATALNEDQRQIVVNVPAGVYDPVSGRLLPALVIELVPKIGLRALPADAGGVA